MTLKTRKKHTNQQKDTQDRPRLDPYQSRQSSRQDHASIQPGNLSGAGSEGGDAYTIGGNAPAPDLTQRGNRQRGGGGNR